MSKGAFVPGGTNIKFSASTTSADEAISTGQHFARIVNATAGVAFVKFGEGAALTAVDPDDIPVAAGESLIVKIGTTVNIAAVVLSTGTGSVHVQPGNLV